MRCQADGGAIRSGLTLRRSALGAVSLDAVLAYSFQQPRPVDQPCDFFLLKVERFREFVAEVLRETFATVDTEAAERREACENVNRYDLLRSLLEDALPAHHRALAHGWGHGRGVSAGGGHGRRAGRDVHGIYERR